MESPSELNLPLFGIPWLQDWVNPNEGLREQAVSAATEQMRKESDGSFHSLLVTHAPFILLVLSFLLSSMTRLNLCLYCQSVNSSVYYGHIHEAHGVYTSGDVKFANAGAISRGSIHEHNLTRSISVTTWDSGSGASLSPSPSHKPSSEVFRLEESKAAKTVQMELDAFLASVGRTSIEITSVESVLQHVREMGLAPEVTAVVESYWRAWASNEQG